MTKQPTMSNCSSGYRRACRTLDWHVFPLGSTDLQKSPRPSLSRCAENSLVGSLEQREQYLHNFFCLDPAVHVLVGHDKLLSVRQSDRDHHPSASLELID